MIKWIRNEIESVIISRKKRNFFFLSLKQNIAKKEKDDREESVKGILLNVFMKSTKKGYIRW
jgi:hypothetical protein